MYSLNVFHSSEKNKPRKKKKAAEEMRKTLKDTEKWVSWLPAEPPSVEWNAVAMQQDNL